MTSIEKQITIEELKFSEVSADSNKKTENPVVITLVQGQSGTLYRNQSDGNDIPDKLLYE